MELCANALDALAVFGGNSLAASEVGFGPSTLQSLVHKGLLTADTDRRPALYQITSTGLALIEELNCPVSPVDREAPIARIQRIVAKHYRIPLIEMVSARRAREVARPRQIAMYLSKLLTPKSLPDIGRLFGNRDHTTVIHACRQITRLIAEDPEIRADVRRLTRKLSH